jgi:hypothetical protein
VLESAGGAAGSVLAFWPSATSIAESPVSAAPPLDGLPVEPLPDALWGTVRRVRRSSFTAIASQMSGLSNEKLLSYSWIEPSCSGCSESSSHGVSTLHRVDWISYLVDVLFNCYVFQTFLQKCDQRPRWYFSLCSARFNNQ